MTDQDFEAQLQVRRNKRDAFIAVFGVEGKRSVHQELVLQDLERLAHYGDTALSTDQTGRFDGGITAYRVGMQDVVKRIYLRINWRESDGERSRDHPDHDER